MAELCEEITDMGPQTEPGNVTVKKPIFKVFKCELRECKLASKYFQENSPQKSKIT